MAKNQVFVSPGVFTSETDLTFVSRQVGVTTLGLVGETVKGPAFQPIFITNYDEFRTFFGGTNPAKYKGNNFPKYELPYIAKSYLSESNQLYVTRTLGLSGYKAGIGLGITLDAALDETTVEEVDTTLTGSFGWTGTSNTMTTIDVTGDLKTLIETIFDSGEYTVSFNNIANEDDGNSGTFSLAWTKDGVTNTFDGVEFDYEITSKVSGVTHYTGAVDITASTVYSGTSYADVENMLVALLRSRGSYSSDEVLEYDITSSTPIIFDPAETSVEFDPYGNFILSGTTTGGFNFSYDLSLDNKKRNFITRVLGNTDEDGNTALFVEKLYKTTLDKLVADNKVKGLKLTLADFGTEYNNYLEEYQPAVTPYFVSELRGNKVLRLFRLWTISDGNTANSDIKVSITNINPDAREFDIIIRSYSDTDNNLTVLEGFTKCSMDPTSANFVGKKVGTLDGNFPNRSSYVLLELAEGVDTSDAFPAGFLGYSINDFHTDGGANVPMINYKTTYEPFENKRRFYLGLSDTVGIDNSFFNYLGNIDNKVLTKGFHMDVNAASVNVDGYDTQLEFHTGCCEFQTNSGLVGTDYQDIKARKFTAVPAGGFDGWDIYRDARTNTNNYSIFAKKGQDGVTQGNFTVFPASNGMDGITSDYYAYLEAILTFNNPELANINVFATPGIDTFNNINLVDETIEMIEQQRADSVYIVTTPDVDAAGDVITEREVVENLDGLFDSNYSATYWPWIQINDVENTQYIWLPPTRDVVRNIARTDNVSFPWFAVAGVERGDVNCIQARKNLTQQQRDVLYDGRINPITRIAGEGIKIWGNKNLQVKDTALNRLNVRRLLLQARKLISAVSMRLLFDQDDDAIRTKFLEQVNPILSNIRSERGLEDFRVTVDRSSESKDRRELNGKIHIKPINALEYVYINFTLYPGGASFDDV